LNHNYIKDTTPQGYRDWLSLVKESIKNPKNPIINLANQGVKKVAELIDYEKLSPEELRESKNRNAAESAKEAYKLAAEREVLVEIAKNAIRKGLDNQFIRELTGLTLEQIEELRIETKE
jgi:nitrogen regulatory protein PII-like uncharacterized protein